MGATKFHPCVDETIDGYDKRKWTRKPSLIVIHHTGTGNFILSTLTAIKQRAYNTAICRYLGLADKNYVSAHFDIGRDGWITQIIDPRTHVAFHAGQSRWYDPMTKAVLDGCNNFSIGIELLGDGNKEPYSAEQYDALVELIQALQFEFPTIPKDSITGHQFIAPKRKVDPGKYFDWKRLHEMLGVDIKLKAWGREL